MITKEKKQEIIKEYQLKEGDTGSPEVQVAILTYRETSSPVFRSSSPSAQTR